MRRNSVESVQANDKAAVMRAKIVRIGNSRGIRLPRPILEQCGFGDAVEMQVENGQLLLRPVTEVRAGWEDAFRRMAEAGDDQLLDGDHSLTEWDETEWEW